MQFEYDGTLWCWEIDCQTVYSALTCIQYYRTHTAIVLLTSEHTFNSNQAILFLPSISSTNRSWSIQSLSRLPNLNMFEVCLMNLSIFSHVVYESAYKINAKLIHLKCLKRGFNSMLSYSFLFASTEEKKMSGGELSSKSDTTAHIEIQPPSSQIITWAIMQ